MGSAAHCLIVGCGDTGRRVAARAVAAGWDVTAIARSAASARNARAVGAETRVLNLDTEPIPAIACDRLFYFAPPPAEGDTDGRLSRVLDALAASPPSITVYISTSGVYGDAGGAWVDETSPVNPGTARARRRVDAENRIRAFLPGARILRVPGIYGPGRLPIERVRAGEPIVADAESGWTNRIHIDDLAAVAWQASDSNWPPGVINASDGTPTPPGVYYDALAELIGVAPVPRITWAEAEKRFSQMRLSFLRESRRLDNTRLRAALGRSLRYADFHYGLVASIAAHV